MNPYEHSTVLPPEPDKAGRMFFPAFAGAGIWIILIVSVYVILPRLLKIFVDFGIVIGPLAIFVIVYAGLLLPFIGIAAGASLAAMQSRRWYLFVLIWLPMILMGVLLLTVGPVLARLLNDLA